MEQIFYEDLPSTEICTPNGVQKIVSDFKILTLRINYIIIIGLLPKKSINHIIWHLGGELYEENRHKSIR